MLDAVRPDIAVVSPGWVNERVPMIAAATQTGCHIYCGKAMLELREPGDAYIYPAPRVLPDHTKLSWEKLHLADGHDRPENTPDFLRKNWLDLGNQALARDLIDAIDHDREPLSSLGQVRSINEMVQGVYASHLSGGRRVELPLAYRSHPLAD